MMTMTPYQFVRRQIRRRRRGRVVPPCVTVEFETLPVTTPYGATGNPAWSLGRHTGEDHAAPTGALAVAVSWGVVVCVARWRLGQPTRAAGPVVQWGSAYGTHVIIRTASGAYDYAYCHLSSIEQGVEPGVRVFPGMILGRTGHSGGSGDFGPHLHLEARPAGGRFGSDVNPIHVKQQEGDL